MAVKTQAQITAEIAQYIIDNTQGAITPAQMRQILNDLNDSLLNVAGNTQNANTVFAGPNAGGPAAPSFRSLVGADLPAPTLVALGGIKAINAVTGQFLKNITTAGVPVLAAPVATDISDSTTVGRAVLTAANAAAARSAIGSGATGDALFTAATAGAARTTLGSTSVGDALFIAVSKAAGLTALGLNDGSGGGITITSQNSSALAGFRNRLMNGNFTINQRVYVSTTATASGVYMHDRWKSTTAATAYTFTQGKPDTLITITAGTIAQVVEDVNVEGGVYTLSWSGTATARIAINGGAPAGGFAASPIVTSSATAGQAITVEFSTGTLGLVQLEPGSVATTFERVDFNTELVRCERYYEKSFNYAQVPASNIGAQGGHVFMQVVGASLAAVPPPVKFQVRKRSITPTITFYNPGAAGAQIRNISKSTDWTLTNTTGQGDCGFGITGTSPAGSVLADTCAVHWTAEAEL